MNPFDYVNSISYNKKDIMKDEYDEKQYPAFLVNKALSLYPDTIFYANEMNMRPGNDNRLAYDYYLNSIRPRKRFSKWFKRQDNENVEIVMEYYKVDYRLATEYLSILSKEQVGELKTRLYKGE
jgi:hypothetical protein